MSILRALRNWMLPLEAINIALPSQGIIYEIGCGMGVISNYLGKKSKRFVIGTDIDESKIRLLQKMCNLSNVSFVVADASTYSYEECTGVVLSDFLHHVPHKTQEKILRKVAKSLKKNGILIIKEIDKKDGIRMWMSRFWDLVFYPKDKIYYREKNDLIKLISSMGFSVKVGRDVQWFPGSTFLFVCRKN